MSSTLLRLLLAALTLLVSLGCDDEPLLYTTVNTPDPHAACEAACDEVLLGCLDSLHDEGCSDAAVQEAAQRCRAACASPETQRQLQLLVHERCAATTPIVINLVEPLPQLCQLPPPCTATCDLAFTTRCAPDGAIQTCQPAPDTCLAWIPTARCGAAQRCDASSGQAACVPVCADVCELAATRCDDAGDVERCSAGVDGCSRWTLEVDCAEPEVCDASSGQAACAPVCADACELDTTRCDDAGDVERCSAGVDGCSRWTLEVACEEPEVCAASNGAASCTPPSCTHTCELEGEAQCGSSGDVETCLLSPAGCLEWAVTLDCAGSCEAPSGAPACSCPEQVWEGSYEGDPAGIAGYTRITGDLRLDEQEALTHVDPLACLKQIDGALSIRSNPALVSLEGLSGLTRVGGSLGISSAVLRSLAGLSSLTQVGDDLTIGSSLLEDLEGLSSLTHIGGTLYVVWNEALTSLGGLSNLSTVGGVYLAFNPRLADLSALSNLSSLEWFYASRNIVSNIDFMLEIEHIDRVGIEYEPALTSVDGLSGVSRVNGITIRGNDALVDVNGLSNIVRVENNLEISGNPALMNLNGLSSLREIGGSLELQGNPLITELGGLSKLASIGGNMTLASNANLTDLTGLASLARIDGGLTLSSNARLANLDGLSLITQLGGDLRISDNPALESLEGLSNLTRVEGLILSGNDRVTSLDSFSGLTGDIDLVWIRYNGSLASLDGLSGLTWINSLELVFNSRLRDLSGLAQLTEIGSNLRIGLNAALENIDALSGLSLIGLNLLIEDNPLLEDLDGLSDLTYIGFSLVVSGNGSLVNLGGLSQLNFLRDLVIESNAALCQESADALLSLLNSQAEFDPQVYGLSHNGGSCGGTCAAPRELNRSRRGLGETRGSGAFVGTCAGEGSAEEVWRFVPEVSSTVCIRSEGSLYDTALYVREGSCEDGTAEVACNDDGRAGVGWSQVQLDVMEGSDYFIFVDGVDGGAGTYRFAITAGACPP